MCGIFGHIGKKNSLDQCLNGLKFLEYRGYDSAGIAGFHQGNLFCFKEKGKILDLEKTLDRKLRAQSVIGHTRWATHGEASKFNAHPHLDQKKEIALVHNGILENHRSLRAMLESKGVVFETETDTEVIVQLIAHLNRGDLVKALQEAASLMEGFWGLALIHKDNPDQILATSRENPIVVGISRKHNEAFVSSDPYAFMRKDLDLYFLKNDEIAVITKEKIKIFDKNSKLIPKKPEHIDIPNVELDKGNFEHFMLKEIFEQPHAIRSSIHNRFLLESGEAYFENFSLSKSQFQKINRILILGCGSSWHAGCIAALQFEAFTHICTQAEISSEYRYKETHVDENTFVIALSQSGETFDTIAAVRKIKKTKAQVLAICNVSDSTLMREADHSILLRAGPEISVCSTKAFICQLSVLSLLALKLGRFGFINKEKGQEFIQQIIDLPCIVDQVLEQKGNLKILAKKYVKSSNFFFLGRQYMYPASLEAALKLKEISYLNAFGYPSGELKHGPIALIDSQSLVIGLCGNSLTYSKILSNLTEVKARGGKVLAFAPIGSKDLEPIADDVLYLPTLCDEFACIPYSVAAQIFAYYTAKERGAEIDQPRNLAKSVTVE